MTRRIVMLLFIVVATSSLIAAGYFGVRRFLRDRQSVAAYNGAMPVRPVTRTIPVNGRENRTLTPLEIETFKKTGKLPPGFQATSSAPGSPNSSDATVQRTLRTLEEINKINEMNRRLMEEQQRRK